MGPFEQKQEHAKHYASMRLVTLNDFREFVKLNPQVVVDTVRIQLGHRWKIGEFGPPEGYEYESFTVWSFPDRGSWATHTGDYRGNWSPYIPRNLIWKYTKPGDWVLDQMVGSGTTLVECKLLGRHGIGVDVNQNAVMVAWDRLNFNYTPPGSVCPGDLQIKLYVGDARNLDAVEDASVDLIATHPPYAGIIPYTKAQVTGDLSALKLEEYIEAMRDVAEESIRVLKKDRHCAILIGDTRRQRHYVPISHRVLEAFLEAGFILKEEIIKEQHKTKTTREKWRSRYDFYKIAHEHLFIFRKPVENERLTRYKHSVKWWKNH